MPKGIKETYDPAVADYILKNYKGVTTQELAEMIKTDLGIDESPRRIQCFKKKNKLTSGVDTTFKTGKAAWHAGTKGICNPGGTSSSFKKGHRPHNELPIGSEKLVAGKYIYVKIDDTLGTKASERWKAKHRIIWEKYHNRTVPEGHSVIFADGDCLNYDIDNLVLVSNKELAYLNKKKLIYNDCELTKSGVLVARVAMKAYERRKKDNEKKL